MPVQHYILATAGHVDHGKSALVKALTGTDPDRLPEEKARGITIDLGFAYLDLPAKNRSSGYRLGIVDVPGHEDFVKNMVAGVGSIDLALLVVAVDDGWMPQTEEHFQILSYLGIGRCVVALTKIDISPGGEPRLRNLIRSRLAATPLAEAPIVATSVRTGQGLEALREAMAQTLASTPPPRDVGKPRLPIDRAFTLRGVGTVVTGTLAGGTLSRGQEVVIQPSGQKTRIRTLQNHNREVESSGPGMRTAINLPDLEIRVDDATRGVRRGDVVTVTSLGGSSAMVDAILFKSGRTGDFEPGAIRPLKDGARVRVHHGSAHATARLQLLDTTALAPGATAIGRFRLEEPIFVLAGDRFIVRDWAEQNTLAGGIILDPDPPAGPTGIETRKRLLEQRAAAPAELSGFITSQLELDHAVKRDQLLRRSRFSDEEVGCASNQLVEEGRVGQLGDWLVDVSWWKGLCEVGAREIDREHREHPEQLGLAVTAFRRALTAAGGPAVEYVFEDLVAALCRSEFARRGNSLSRVDHRPALPQPLQAAGSRIRTSLKAKQLEPPRRAELAMDAVGQKAIRFLIESGEVVELNSELIIAAEAYAAAVQAIRTHLRNKRRATVSELRPVVGTSRRVLVPLLERLDRDGVTRRDGDYRTLRNQ